MKTYFKVVKKGLTSCYATGRALVTYKLDEFVKAPFWLPDEHRYLFVFRTQRLAMLFVRARGSSQFQVFSCKGKGERSTLPDFLSAASLSRGSAQVALSLFPGRMKFLELFPPGTAAVREVKLLDRIRPFELPPAIPS